MAASIHSIPLPPASGGLDDSLTWDQSIADIPSLHQDEVFTAARVRKLTFHAVAHGRSVVGISPSLPDDETDIIKWQQTKFDNEVVAVSSNNDGSVIAAATKSHVSLIKGGDGSILATRQIVSEKSRDSSSFPGVIFVSRPQNFAVPDVLVVFSSDNGQSSIILISNIDGPTLNSPDLKKVREAAQNMSIDALALPHSMHVASVSGVYVNEDTIRFFLAGNRKMGVYDYNIEEKKSTVVVGDVSELIPGGWKYNDAVEMCIDDKSEMGTYLVFAACNDSGHNKICWLNILDLALSAQHLCQFEVNSLKAVRSYDAEKCVAAVFATKGTSPKIHVVQSLISEDRKTLKESDSMVLFTINTVSVANTVELAPPSVSLDKGPYSFRFVSKHNGDEDTTCSEFVSGDQARAGLVHFLLANNSFDKSYECINELDQYSGHENISSTIHKSLVALWQFRYVLSKGNISSQENVVEAQECLRRLASSAISGGDKGVQGMVDAAKFLLSWPKNVATYGVHSSDFEKILIKEVCMALSAMTTTIRRVIGALSSSNAVKLEEAMKRLDDRQTALRGLRDIAELDGIQLTLADPYLAIGSLTDLINALVSQGAFKSVERLMKSQLGKAIPSGIVASSVLRIPSGVDPQCYLPWMCDLVVPTLSIRNPLLESIRAWACGIADKYDEENALRGLDFAITLLQAVSKATARLTVAMNNSFAHQPQLDTDTNEANAPETPKHNGSFLSSFDSTISSRSMYARPTVLNVGMISGMRTKGDRVFSAKRVGRTLALSPISSDTSFFSSSSPVADLSIEVDEELGYDCVEDKLQDAMRLKAARSLGMERKSLTLSSYSSKGEQYIVKEIVKASLKQFVAQEKNHREQLDTIRAYALEVNADFDNAVYQYAVELCDSSRDNIPSILQNTEILSRWCSSPAVRCLIVLRMLRKALVSIQKPPDLSKLASEALGLVTDGNVRSELEEAIRLLLIDSLVRKYCGNGAQTFFRVNEAAHITRLIQHVCRHIDVDGVLTDILVLCDAFNTSVSKLDTCVWLLQRVMTACPRTTNGRELSRTDHAAALLQDLYSKDGALAERVGERMIAFCAEVLEDCNVNTKNVLTSTAKQQALTASSTACSILSIMRDNAHQVRKLDRVNMNISTALKEFQRIAELQRGCDIFLTVAEIQDPSSCVSILVDLLQPCVNLLQQKSFKLEDGSLREKLKPMLASAKHWCAILCDSPAQVSELWSRAVGTSACYIAKTAHNHASLLLLEMSGVLDERSGHSSIHSVISVALTLCGRAYTEAANMSNSMPLSSKGEGELSATLLAMKSMAQASLLLREHIVSFSQPFMLPSAISLSNLIEFVCEISCQSDLGIGDKLEKYISLLQAGSRKHRQQQNRSTKAGSEYKTRLPTTPVLHPTWYIGDGLLLRPNDTLLISMAACEMILGFESNKSSPYLLMKASDIIHALESRGAHSASLRLISFSESVSLSKSVSSLPFSEPTIKNISAALAERSLGGVEAGITSGTIDSVLSISFLLHMPKEKAFNIYKAALPSAIGKQDFPRILTLASIGASCGLGRFSSGEPYPWKKQNKFIDQCKSFIVNAKIWSILSRYKVSFDTSVFIQVSDSSSITLEGYCKRLTWNAAKHLDPKATLLLVTNFAKQCGVNKYASVSALIEFLLSNPSQQHENETDKTDIRWDLLAVEESVRKVCLPMLPIINQSKVLRKAVMSLEQSSSNCGTDYDRHTMVLSLYKESIDELAGYMTSESRQKAHEQESGRVNRRLNALIVLSSIFDDKYPAEKKPNYTKLFEPLPIDPSALSPAKQAKYNLLGSDENVFDPLSALHHVLREDATNGMAAALSPLCSLLGLPSGYMHARALVVHFSKLKEIGETLPSVDSVVFPVVKKLVAPSDRADLSWWCSFQYENGSSEQLKCMDLAYNNATLASEQAELKGGGSNAEEGRNAIDKVKQIDLARAMLSDQIIVNEVITRNGSTSAIVKAVYKDIIQRIQDSLHESDYMPEKLVKELLVEGSMAAAEASLDENGTFSTSHFRSLAILVHDACRLLSARYSHVNVGRCARGVTRRWLVHGDSINSGSAADARSDRSATEKVKQPSSENIQAPKISSIDEDGTTEFIMDIGSMNISSGDYIWNGQSSRYEQESSIKSSDEPSIFHPMSSQRELSDFQTSRVALRISFLMCFAEDYHQGEHDENANTNVGKVTKVKLHKGTRQKASCFEGDLALAHAKELLGIVFARQGCTVASTFAYMLDDSHDGSSMHEEDAVRTNGSKALSFAMRYRALRVASILCPHDVLVRVILEQGYASDFDDNFLAKVAFGSFLAMEIEAMGLSLPHSDLAQLSTMHFPSYARTLWRNNGLSSGRLGGRLHLLLMELSVNHHETVDWELLILMLEEITKSELPRSLLLACECTVQSNALARAALVGRKDVLHCINSATKKLVELLSNEIRSSTSSEPLDVSACAFTVDRIVFVVDNLEAPEVVYFAEAFATLSAQCPEQGQVELSEILFRAAVRIASHLTDASLLSRAWPVIKSLNDNHGLATCNYSPQIMDSTPSVCAESIQDYEKSFYFG